MEESEINNFESEGEVLGELEELDLDDGLNKSTNNEDNFTNNLLYSLQTKEIQESLCNIFIRYFQSGKTNLKNIKPSEKRNNIPEDDEEYDKFAEDFEKENINGEKKKNKIRKKE